MKKKVELVNRMVLINPVRGFKKRDGATCTVDLDHCVCLSNRKI